MHIENINTYVYVNIHIDVNQLQISCFNTRAIRLNSRENRKSITHS
jgi:hypothetical protein